MKKRYYIERDEVWFGGPAVWLICDRTIDIGKEGSDEIAVFYGSRRQAKICCDALNKSEESK